MVPSGFRGFGMQSSSPQLITYWACAPLTEAGFLIVKPARPQSRQRIQQLIGPPTLAGEPHLHLRTRLRSAEHDGYSDGIAVVCCGWNGKSALCVQHPG
jgi:hypothetical protein